MKKKKDFKKRRQKRERERKELQTLFRSKKISILSVINTHTHKMQQIKTKPN